MGLDWSHASEINIQHLQQALTLESTEQEEDNLRK